MLVDGGHLGGLACCLAGACVAVAASVARMVLAAAVARIARRQMETH